MPHDAGVVRAPHRAHGPRRPRGHGHAVRHAARGADDARDRALHGPAHQADEDAERRPTSPRAATAVFKERLLQGAGGRTIWNCTWRWSRSWREESGCRHGRDRRGGGEAGARRPAAPASWARARAPKSCRPRRRHGAAVHRRRPQRTAWAPPTSSARSPTRRTFPGKAIGAIDIYDRFTFVEVPAEYRDRILERMVNVEIRNRPVHVKLASPSVHGDRAPGGHRERGAGKPFRKAGKPPFKGRAASRRRKGTSKGKG